jgi:hypothetical protein
MFFTEEVQSLEDLFNKMTTNPMMKHPMSLILQQYFFFDSLLVSSILFFHQLTFVLKFHPQNFKYYYGMGLNTNNFSMIGSSRHKVVINMD